MEILQNLDAQIFLFLNSFNSPFTDQFMKLFSGRFVWVPMYMTILFMIVKSFDARRALIITTAALLLIFVTDQTCATLIRPMCERLRPSNLLNPISEFTHIVDGYRGGPYGFPSCHAANSFALAVFLSLVFRKQRFIVMILGWAFVNSYSRICLGVHYPGDLLAGAIIGSALAAATYLLVRAISFGHRPLYNVANDSASVLFVMPAGYLSPLLRVTVINFRYSDCVTSVALATVAVIALVAA